MRVGRSSKQELTDLYSELLRHDLLVTAGVPEQRLEPAHPPLVPARGVRPPRVERRHAAMVGASRLVSSHNEQPRDCRRGAERLV